MWKCLVINQCSQISNILLTHILFQLKGFRVFLCPRNFNPIVNIDSNKYLKIKKRLIKHIFNLDRSQALSIYFYSFPKKIDLYDLKKIYHRTESIFIIQLKSKFQGMTYIKVHLILYQAYLLTFAFSIISSIRVQVNHTVSQ